MTRTMTVSALIRELVDRGYTHVTSDVPCQACGAWPHHHADLRAAVEAVLASPAVDRRSDEVELGLELEQRDIH